MQMNIESLITERLAFALGRLDLAPSYRELLLSVGKDHLKAQFDHYTACNPPVYLPFLCCEANGVNPQRAVGVASAWFLLQVAAHLLDKVEDQELEVVGLPLHGQGVYTNLSTGMIFVAEWILNHLELDCVDAGAAWDIQRAFQETVLSVCSGQHLDLSVAMPDLSTCWQIAEAKSGSAYALACYVGTRTATQQSDRLRHLENFGRSLGTIVQISDDIEDLERDTFRSEKKNMLSPLANAYLAHVGANLGEIPKAYSIHGSEMSSLQNCLVLYLRLEALKYAEMARKELSAIQLATGPRDQILAILNHLSWLGANVN
jgi:geranylgeranyl pyrophosphate synthase